MIKKIFKTFLLFSLFLVSSCVDKKEKALEICSDTYWTSHLRTYSSDLLDIMDFNDSTKTISQLTESLKKLKDRKDLEIKELQKFYKEYYNSSSDGSEPSSIKIPVNYDKNKLIDYMSKIESEKKNLKFLLDGTNYSIKMTTRELNAQKINYLEEIWKRKNLKQKISNTVYLDFFIRCEKEYNNAQTAFLTKWLNYR
jgi:hypothetical protein